MFGRCEMAKTKIKKLKRTKKLRQPAPATLAGHGAAARLVGPEDVAIGQYVTIVEHTREVMWLDDQQFGDPASALRRVKVTQRVDDAGLPLKILGVSLPFVFVQNAHGSRFAVDLACSRLARLDAGYGKAAFPAKKKRKRK
jgi:hypothetical protein